MSIVLTIIIGLILLAIYCLANLGVVAFFDDNNNDGCMGIGLFIAILIVFLIIIYGLRTCVS